MAACFLVVTRWPDAGDGFVVLSFALAMTLLLAISIRRLGCAGRILVSFVLSVGLVGIFELLAWIVLPDLHHDLVPFSPPHVWRMMIVAIFATGAVGGLMLVLSILTIDSLLEPPESSTD